MSDQTRGITCPDMRRIVRAALDSGWEWTGINGNTHCAIRWPATGEKVRFGTTPSLASWKTVAAEVKRISGTDVWRKGNRKRSRKADQLTGFSVEVAAREQRGWHDAWGARVDNLHAQHREAKALLAGMVAAQNRTAAAQARDIVATLVKVEAELTAMHQPFTPFRM